MTNFCNIIADDFIPHNDIHVRARDKPDRGLSRQCKRLQEKGNGRAMRLTMRSFVRKGERLNQPSDKSQDKFYNNTASKLIDLNTSAK